MIAEAFVPCPYCGAAAGAPCTRLWVPPAWSSSPEEALPLSYPHVERIRAAS